MSSVTEELAEAPVEFEQRVTALELFFDLVFVFAITQVTGYVSADPTWTRLFEGLAILAALWWAWVAYSWLGNTAGSDEGLMRIVLLSAMAGMLVASLAVPHAFGYDGLLFGVAYLVVRVLHIGAYTVISRDDPQLRFAVGRLASTIMPAALLLVIAGALSGTGRAVFWVLALALDYGGVALRGVEGWQVVASHFAERHADVIIIALGESIVSLGVGAAHLHVGAQLIVAALLGMAIAGTLWWAYFDVVAIVGESRLRAAPERSRALMARDSYSYLHLPMVGGIVFFAVGVKLTLSSGGSHLGDVSAASLCGGAALYLIAMSAFKRRNIGSWNRPRLVAAAALVALAPVATGVSALVSLTLVALVTSALIAYEVTAYREARQRIRHGG
jgi:low temperature requirement protein LtrA